METKKGVLCKPLRQSPDLQSKIDNSDEWKAGKIDVSLEEFELAEDEKLSEIGSNKWNEFVSQLMGELESRNRALHRKDQIIMYLERENQILQNEINELKKRLE